MPKSPQSIHGLSPESRASERTRAGSAARVRSDDLLRGRTELIIEHQGRDYRLRITQNGKLILTA